MGTMGDTLNERRLALLQGGEDITAYPSTEDAWQDRYQRLLDRYHGHTYDFGFVKRLQLFRALDDDGYLLGMTRTLHRDLQYIIDTAKSALAVAEVTLEQPEGIPDADFAIAEAIWEASDVDAVGDVWALLLACAGDLLIEPARVDPDSDQVTLVHYLPQTVYLEYDAVTGTRLQRGVITSRITDAAQVDAEGNVFEEGALYVHQREVDRARITVRSQMPQDSEGAQQNIVDTRASGAHGLGVCPLVHIRCIPAAYPEHSLPVTHALERPLAEIDSLASQMSAVGDRFANPKPYLFGAKMGNGDEYSRFGRWINAWGNNAANVKAGYIEPTMSGMNALQEALERLIRDVRLTFPEFLFVGGGSTANLSGEALRLLSTQYVRKYMAIRRRLYGGLERALGIGVALAQRRAFDPARLPVRLMGPPLLPADVGAELDVLAKAKEIGGVTHIDIIRRTQALDIASDDVSAEDYAALVAEEEMGRATMLLGDDTPDPIEDAPTEEAGPTDGPDAGEPLAATALNGAQVTGLLAVLEQVSAGTLESGAAVVLIVNAFPTIDAAEAERIVAGAVPAPAPEPAAAPPPPTVGTQGADGLPRFEDDGEDDDLPLDEEA